MTKEKKTLENRTDPKIVEKIEDKEIIAMLDEEIASITIRCNVQDEKINTLSSALNGQRAQLSNYVKILNIQATQIFSLIVKVSLLNVGLCIDKYEDFMKWAFGKNVMNTKLAELYISWNAVHDNFKIDSSDGMTEDKVNDMVSIYKLEKE